MDINSTYELIKTIIADVKGLSDKQLANSIMSNLLELEEKLIEMKSDEGSKLEEIDSLKKEIILLKKAKDVRWTKNGYGTYVDEFGTEHNYCQHCFEKSNKLYEVPFGEYSGQCPECKNFLEKE